MMRECSHTVIWWRTSFWDFVIHGVIISRRGLLVASAKLSTIQRRVEEWSSQCFFWRGGAQDGVPKGAKAIPILSSSSLWVSVDMSGQVPLVYWVRVLDKKILVGIGLVWSLKGSKYVACRNNICNIYTFSAYPSLSHSWTGYLRHREFLQIWDSWPLVLTDRWSKCKVICPYHFHERDINRNNLSCLALTLSRYQSVKLW